MARSRKRFVWLDHFRMRDGGRQRAEALLLSGPNAAPREALKEDMDASSALADKLLSCSQASAEVLARSFHFEEPPLAFQPNFAHSDFPVCARV